MAATTKTWNDLVNALEETARKWRISDVTLTSALLPRARTKAYHSEEERTVKVTFGVFNEDGAPIPVTLIVKKRPRAHDNLALIAKALELTRQAERDGAGKVLAVILRQLYPAPAKTVTVYVDRPVPAPPPSTDPRSPAAALHIADDAPLAVAEAAYRTLMRQHHPDVGGDPAMARRLNAAIETLRQAAQQE